MKKLPFKILGIEHVGVALKELDTASGFLSLLNGVNQTGTEVIDDQRVKTDIFDTGKGKIELLKATTQNSPITKFLNRRGKGLHHLALEVDNLGNALEFLKKNNIILIDEKPRIGAEGYQIAFVHPKSTGGILVELCQRPNTEDTG